MIKTTIISIFCLQSIVCFSQEIDTNRTVTRVKKVIKIQKNDSLIKQELSTDTLILIERDTFSAAPLHSEYNEINLENLDEKTAKYFSKQDAVSSIYQIEGFLFQGISVFLEGKEKSVAKAWKDYLYRTNRIKLKAKKAKSFFNRTKTPYYKASEVRLTNVSHRMGDLITVFQRENGMVKMTVIFKLGYNTSINAENFPEANVRLTNYVEQFSQVNFREYYGEHLKELGKSIKTVDRELKKENKVLRKMERAYKKAAQNSEEEKRFKELSIVIQKKLIQTLQEERNGYEVSVVKYKNRNSQIRSQISNTGN